MPITSVLGSPQGNDRNNSSQNRKDNKNSDLLFGKSMLILPEKKTNEVVDSIIGLKKIVETQAKETKEYRTKQMTNMVFKMDTEQLNQLVNTEHKLMLGFKDNQIKQLDIIFSKANTAFSKAISFSMLLRFKDISTKKLDKSIKTSTELMLGFTKVIHILDKNSQSLDKTLNILSKAAIGLKPLMDLMITMGENGKKISTSLLMMGGALTIFTLNFALLGMLPWESLGKGLVAIGGLVLLSNFIKQDKSHLNMLLFSGSILVLTYALKEFSEVKWESILKASVSIAVFNGVIQLFGSSNSIKGMIGFGLSTVALFGFSEVLKRFPDMTLEKAGTIIGSLIGTGLAFAGIGLLSTQIIMGSLATGAMALGMYGFFKSLESIPKDVNLEVLGKMGIAFGSIGLAFAAIGNPITLPLVLAGALAAGGISAGVFALGGAMKIINTVSVDEEKVKVFSSGTQTLTNMLADVGSPLKLPLIALAATQSLAILGAVTPMAGAFAILNKVKVDVEKIDIFGEGVSSLTDTFVDVGKNPLTLLAVTSGTASSLQMSLSAISIATAINAFTKKSIGREQVMNATFAMRTFIQETSKAFNEARGDFDNIEDGITAFTDIGNLMLNIADGTQKLANLQFVEQEVVNGKLKVKSTRSFTPEDFSKVGQSVGMILNSLTEPLAKIGGSSSTFSIGGFEITNPFSNEVEDGIEAISKIGTAFDPIATLVDTFLKNDVTGEKVDAINTILLKMFTGLNTTFSTVKKDMNLEEFNNDITYIFSGIAKLFEVTNQDAITLLGETETKFDNIFSRFKDPTLFDNSIKGMKALRSEMKGMVKDLEEIPLEKLSKMNDFIYNISNFEASDDFSDLKEILLELFKQFANTNQLNQQQQITQTTTNNTNTNQGISEAERIILEQDKEFNVVLDERLIQMLELMQEFIDSITDGRAKFQPIE